MLKGPKRRFANVLVVLVGRREGGNHESKMFQKEQKMFAKKIASY